MSFKSSFGNVDFDFSVKQVDIESSINSDTVWSGEEDVANDLAWAEWMIWNVFSDCATDFVGQKHEHFSFGVSINLIVSISLDLCFIPNLIFFPSFIDGCNEFIHLWVSIQVSPQDLSISWIVPSGEVLFSTIINYRNTHWS